MAEHQNISTSSENVFYGIRHDAIEFWKMCNGKRKITELVDLFAKHTGMQRSSGKRSLQLIQQLREGGLVVISTSPETPNVKFDRS